MNLRDFLARFLDKKPKPLVNNFDSKLFIKVNQKFLPSSTQFKYFYRFLNQTERKIVKISLIIMAVSVLSWGAIFIARHSAFTPKVGGEYSEAMIGQPKLLNPLFSSTNDIDSDLVSLIYSGLFRYDKNLKLIPDLASDYSISDDKKIFTITLRDNVKWSDGEPFSADDVLFTFESIQNPLVSSPLYSAFQSVVVEKISADKIRFILKEPFAPFLHSLTVGILPEHIWTDTAPDSFKLPAKNNFQPIGSGPWKFEKMIKDDTGTIQSYTLSHNDKYYGQIPYLKTLTILFFNDYPEAIDALREQSVSALSFVPRQLKEKLSKKNLNVYSLELPQYTSLFFNQEASADLKDYDLRLSLAESLDKNKIIADALQGDGLTVDSPILKGKIGYYPEIKKISYNLDVANNTLDKKWKRISPEEYFKLKYNEILKRRQPEIDAVVKNSSSTTEIASSTVEKINQEITDAVRQEMNADQLFYRKDKNDKILSITITTADTAEYGQAAESISKMWRAIGVQTNIRMISSRQLSREVLKPRDYQILLYGEILGGDPDPFPFWHSSQTEYPGLNLAMFGNRTADKLLEDARIAIDENKRDEMYKKFQDILVKELPAIFLYTPNYTFAVDNNIKGISNQQLSNPSDRFNNLNNWYTKTKWSWK